MAIEDPSLIVYFNSYKRPFIDDVQATPVCLAEGNLPVSVSIRLAVTSIWPRIRMVGSWQLLWLLNVAAFWGSISKWLRLCKISEWFGMNPHCPIAIYIYLRLLTSYSTVHLVDLVVVFFHINTSPGGLLVQEGWPDGHEDSGSQHWPWLLVFLGRPEQCPLAAQLENTLVGKESGCLCDWWYPSDFW
jgi:hypothetical protein